MKRFSVLVVLALFTVLGISAQPADYSKMSPMLQHEAYIYQAAVRSSGPRKAQAQAGAVAALVKVSSEKALTDNGCLVLDRVGDICIALLPVSRLDALAADSRILSMENRPASKELTDSIHSSIHTDAVYSGQQLPQAFTGKGVLVGIADSGFDYMHPMFLDADGHTRIKMAWDMFTGMSDAPSQMGSTYTTAEQLAAAKGSTDSIQTHGTHVAGIAAGSQVKGVKTGRSYRGVACEADLALNTALVSYASEDMLANIYKSLQNLDLSTADELIKQVLSRQITWGTCLELLAIKQVIDYAKAQGQPCVVNCSFGGQETLLGRNPLEEELYDKLIDAGHIIVASSGNYADSDIYRLKAPGETLSETLWFNTFSTGMTMRATGDFKLKLNLNATHFDEDFVFDSNELQAGQYLRDSVVYAVGEGAEEVRYMLKYVVECFAMADGQKGYSVAMTLPNNRALYYERDGTSVGHINLTAEGEGKLELMGMFDNLAFNRLSRSGYATNAPYTVPAPAAYDNIIAVGLTSHRDSVVNLNGKTLSASYNFNPVGRVVSWSGTGPTLRGNMKPDITAPGFNIVSAYSSQHKASLFTPTLQIKQVDLVNFNSKDYHLMADCGTSMSAPVVTGVIALWLQADPTLTPQRIKEILAETSNHPETDIDYPNYRYGQGEIDAYKGLLKILNLTGIDDISTHQPLQATFRLNGRTLSIDGVERASVSIYSTDGRLLRRVDTANGQVDLSLLPAGVFAVQVNTGNRLTTGSTLIRL